jgi:hypothetical protein
MSSITKTKTTTAMPTPATKNLTHRGSPGGLLGGQSSIESGALPVIIAP